jgi:hypothetical protein
MKNVKELQNEQEQLRNNVLFKDLSAALEAAHTTLETAKTEKETAERAYQQALGNGEKDEVLLLELLTSYRQAKYQHLFYKAGYHLAKYKLEHFLDQQRKAKA